MAVRVSYVLEIGGRLDGDLAANNVIIPQVQLVLPTVPPVGPPPPDWPRGFVPPGWQVRFWDSRAEIGGSPLRPETRISFRAEVSVVLDGTIHGNQGQLNQHFQRFSNHRGEQWHQQLIVQLGTLNQQIVTQHGPARLIERIWFREWQFYCGNGGDS